MTDSEGAQGKLRHLTYITLAQAAKSLPPSWNGRPVHVSTILRWIVDGSLSPAGHRVHLQAVRMDGRWLTTVAWLEDYSRLLTPNLAGARVVGGHAPVTGHSAARVGQVLDRLGF